MPEMQATSKRYWPMIFALGLLLGIGIGYGVFKWQASLVQTKAPASAPAPVVASQPPPEDNPLPLPEVQPPAGGETRPQAGTADERRARMQAIIDRMTPEQRARATELRDRVRQNAADWQNLTPEERRQRMADIATNTLGMSPEAFQRLQSRFNLTPEQEERWRQRMQEMRDRRNRTPR